MEHNRGTNQSGMSRMENWNSEIVELQRRVDHLAATEMQNHEKHVTGLYNNLERARNRIVEVRSKSGTNWPLYEMDRDDAVLEVERLLSDTRRVLDEYDNGNQGWAEGMATMREHDSEGWAEGQGADLPERDSEGWAEGMGHQQTDSEGWSEGMSERSKRQRR